MAGKKEKWGADTMAVSCPSSIIAVAKVKDNVMWSGVLKEDNFQLFGINSFQACKFAA